jgi:hypothetical protein
MSQVADDPDGVVASATPNEARSVENSIETNAEAIRPCRYCRAAYPTNEPMDCEWTHRDEQRVYDLARAFAKVCQDRHPSDKQIAWFLADADAVVDDFDPTPDKWRVRKLPDKFDEFDARLRINDVTYVIPVADNECETHPIRLSTLRSWQRGEE